MRIKLTIGNLAADYRFTSATGVIKDIFASVSLPRCSAILVTDGTVSTPAVNEVLASIPAPWGVGVYEMDKDNRTDVENSLILSEARKLRMSSWCVNVVVLSDDPAFLASFAESSLRGRLLVWATRLLVVTRRPLQEVGGVLATHWTFSMMNAMVVILGEENFARINGTCYMSTFSTTFLPLPTVFSLVSLPLNSSTMSKTSKQTVQGSQVVRLAHWTPQRGLAVRSGSKLFPQKFDNFYGGRISVTAKNYKPLWFEVEEVAPNGRVLKRTTGMDYLLLDAVSKSLNFTYNNLHVDSWAEALDLTSQRISFVTPVYHAVLATRLKRFDYSMGYTFAFISFSMKKPEIQPQWQSLYYPLADQVWLAILMIVILAPGLLVVVRCVARTEAALLDDRDVMTLRNGFTLMFGSLLGQSVEMGRTSKNGFRVLVGGWLIFAFIVGTAYRGNLTAALTLPKYPPRPETIEQLVGNAKMVTIMPWGKDFKTYFKDSDSPVFEKLSDLMLVGIDTIEGLQQAIDSRQAHMETIHKLKLDIAEQFTRLDGSTQLYIGRENVMPGLAAWPLPHDAPYTANINRCLLAVVELAVSVLPDSTANGKLKW
ncbi:uncharacterized protein LOC125034667 [Penaeus chinensis]|uniref:uncharacterized protein LOC125034667 n=1 Tax=Penaeus chinensis TaxID=139456 RepID=UPI001FB6359B|nr:uncharacterized protein LOC125034667 [Penaeus chinensis]